TQLSVLVPISLNSPITITHLAEELVMDRTSLSRLLRPLEKSGLVRIVSGEDQRTREVTLTAKVKETIAKAIPFWGRAQAHIVQEMGEERWLNLRKDLVTTMFIARPK
ncbi:MAG: MarR family transcriptional regulator, partial [Chloroflexi bacterium]|nr:MarR family transcriptional regulator [Chloroflexota bacterium]